MRLVVYQQPGNKSGKQWRTEDGAPYGVGKTGNLQQPRCDAAAAASRATSVHRARAATPVAMPRSGELEWWVGC